MANDERPVVLLRFPGGALRARVCGIVESLEWRAVVCGSMAELLALARAERPDLCLLQTPVAADDLVDFDRLSHDAALKSLPSLLIAESSLALPDMDARITGTMRALQAQSALLGPVDVMVVEDSVEELELISSRLTRAGLRVCAATSGHEALWLIRRARPHVLVLDIAMPGGDGFELVSKLRREPPFQRLPLLVYSGLNLQPAHRALLSLGPTRYLVKSHTAPERLIAEVREMLPGGA